MTDLPRNMKGAPFIEPLIGSYEAVRGMEVDSKQESPARFIDMVKMSDRSEKGPYLVLAP